MSIEIPGSAESWREASDPQPRLPALLMQPPTGSLGQRWAHVVGRHALRRRRAEDVYRTSRTPARGLPVADNASVWAFLGGLVRQRRGLLVAAVALNMAAAAAGLVVPRILGGIVDQAHRGSVEQIRTVALGVAALVLVQAALLFTARLASAHVGQGVLADARESVVRTVLRLPVGTVEGASTGDLVTRVTRDTSRMAETVRWALPELTIATVMCTLTVVALLLNSPLLTLPALAAFALLAIGSRGYLRHAPAGYVAESTGYSVINSTITETVEGARTVEALRLTDDREARTRDDIAETAQVERYTLTLRNLLFAMTDLSFHGPLVLILLLGAWGAWNGYVTVGQITTAFLYTTQLVGPLDRLIQSLDITQVGLASTTRLVGIADVPADRTPTASVPAGDHLRLRDLRFAYREGHDVLHGIDLDLRPGERLAIVGPSGSGKSTLGRLIAGINRPRTGVVTVGGVDVMDLPLEELRTQVALVTQEHHVFVGSVRDNVVLAREHEWDADRAETEVRRALDAVDALDWVDRLPQGLDTLVGSGNHPLTPAQAQQIALARLVLADPHTLVLDEATSLIDPQTARHLEGSMHALLADRTVVAIAHRLYTAHDADRIAVVIDGRIAELGSHHELMDRGGEYAALWNAWTQ